MVQIQRVRSKRESVKSPRALQSGVGPAILWYPRFHAGEKSAMDSYDASSFRVRRFLFILTVVMVSVVTTGCSGGGASGTAGNSSGNISTVAGTGTSGSSGDGGAATDAELSSPSGVAVDESNNIYIADTGNNRIREVTASTGVIFTVAGTGTSGFSGDGGAATSAELNAPMGVAVDDSGNIYIADTGNNLIRKVTVSTSTISTVAGGLSMPFAVAVDRSDNIYIADTGNFRIRKVTAFTNVGSTVAGNGSSGSLCNKGGDATDIGLGLPAGVAVDASDNLYLSTGYDQVCEVTASGSISALAGTSNASYSGDGGAAVRATLNSPGGVWVDTVDNIYIADTFNNRVRMITASTGVISTVAGSGATGYSGDGGAATNAELNEPFSVTTDATGNIYIADQKNNCVRMVKAPIASPQVSG
jgi:hypothetical protein